MARPLRAFTLGRGLDPAECCLVAFGGAGGLHAARLADRVGFGTVLVPPHAGVLSAMGMLLTGPVVEEERAYLEAIPRGPNRALEKAAQALAREAATHARPIHGGSTRRELFAALRYRGHRSELWVPATADAAAAFEESFEARFGFRQDLPIEALRLRARLYFGEPAPDAIEAAFADELAARRKERRRKQPRAKATPKGKRVTGKRAADTQELSPGGMLGLAREELPLQRWREGPFAVLDYAGTTIVEAGWRARLLRSGVLEMRRS
jgi:N-methylhydantoinase A